MRYPRSSAVTGPDPAWNKEVRHEPNVLDHPGRPLGIAAAWGLSAAGGAEAVTLDREGHGPFNCPDVRLTRATQDDRGNRGYVFEGPCHFPGDGSQLNVRVRAEFSSGQGALNRALEVVDVTGDMTGKIHTTARNCSRDPFVEGGGVCTGERFISTDLPVVWSTSAPLMASRVPTGQTYTEAGRPPPRRRPSRGGRSSS